MMYLKKYAALSCCLLVIAVAQSTAQEFKGKVIYISRTQEVMIKFPSVIMNFNFTNKEIANQFETRITNNKNLSLNSTSSTPETNLVVAEGSNTHLFTLRYKENLDPGTETIYDFSTKDKLKKEVAKAEKVEVLPITPNQSVSTPPTTPVREEGTKTPVGQSTTAPVATVAAKTPPPPPPAVSNADKFNEIIGQANKAYLESKLDEARILYQQALVIRPQYPWCVSQLEEIEKKKQSAQKIAQQRSVDSSYRSHVSIADNAFNKRSYEVAKFEYNQALAVKPTDQYAAAQLRKIEQAGIQDSYLNYMSIAKNAFQNNEFDQAEMSFNEALKIRPNDAEALKELRKVKPAKAAYQQREKEDKLRQALESRFNDTLALADNMFQAGMYEMAKRKYKDADRLKPGDLHIKQRLSQIESIQASQKLVSNQLRLDSLNIVKYNTEFEKGDKALTAKDYKKARTYFEAARKIAPEQTLAADRIKEIDQVMTQMEDEKKAALQQKAMLDSINKAYNAAIKQGNNQLLKEDYLGAKQSFNTALQLKPQESVPVIQLEKINTKLKELKTEEKYDGFIHLADSAAFIAMDYAQALRWYDSAMVIKPDASYIRKQILVVNKAILEKERLQAEQARNQRFQNAFPVYKKADAAKVERNFPDAYLLYTEFLTKLDTMRLNEYSPSQAYYISQAKDYLSRLQRYKPQPKPAEPLIMTPPAEDGKKKKKKKKSEKPNNKVGSILPVQLSTDDVYAIRKHCGNWC